MSIILTALAVAFAAFCVWLTLRIVNRRERWAKRTAVAMAVCLPVLYVLSVGPEVWLLTNGIISESVAEEFVPFYAPLNWIDSHAPDTFRAGLHWYTNLWRNPDYGYDSETQSE
jgi:hypothetical protein